MSIPIRSPRGQRSKARLASSRRPIGSRPRWAWASWERGGNAFDAAVADGIHAAGRRTASQWSGAATSRSFSMMCAAARPSFPDLGGQGAAPAGATDRALPQRGPRSCARSLGCLPRACLGTFETWMIACWRDYAAPCGSPTCWRRRSAMPITAIRCWSAPAPPSRRWRSCSATHWGLTSSAVYLPNNQVPATGTLFTNTGLAATYSRIVKGAESAGGDRVAQIERARQSWSKGFVADAIDRFCRTQEIMDTSGRRHRGVLTADDMAKWTPHIEAPQTYDYHGFTCVQGLRPVGAGAGDAAGSLRCSRASIFERPRSDRPRLYPSDRRGLRNSPTADREAFYGDPDFGRSCRWRRALVRRLQRA